VKLFRCTCKDKPVLYFENVRCESCGRVTGFCPESMELKPFTEVKAGDNEAPSAESGEAPTTVAAVWEDDAGYRYKQCANWSNHQVCNWMLPLTSDNNPADLRSFDSDPDGLCPACRLNDIIPDLTNPAHQPLWHGLEKAKRRCIFTLLELHLPIHGDDGDESELNPPPILFRFMSDGEAGSNFQQPIEGEEPVLTGHANGVITINLAEADDIARTQTRVAMQERYRTLLGHFRHETGHYYWDIFKALAPDFVEAFRAVFGDENASYQDALDRHYEQGPPAGWQDEFVSSYATMHPWEDWAETWAHYLHIIDTLETQQSFSRHSQMLSDSVRDVSLPFAVGFRGDQGKTDFDGVMHLWIEVSILLNSLNRSMGLPDPYRFVLHQPIQEKLRFVHNTIQRLSTVSNDP
jgi:hypothetical protein